MNIDAQALRNRLSRGGSAAEFAVGITGAAAQSGNQKDEWQDHQQKAVTRK